VDRRGAIITQTYITETNNDGIKRDGKGGGGGSVEWAG